MMNLNFDHMALGLLNSSMTIVFITIALLLIRSLLINLNFQRINVLRLWLALPLACFFSVIILGLISNEIIELPAFYSMPEFNNNALKSQFAISTLTVVFLIWAVIALTKTSLFIIRYHKLKKELTSFLTHEKSNIYYTDMQTTALAIGLFKPIVIIPMSLIDELSSKELSMVKSHEQIHCQRKDPMWRFVLEVVCCLYWFLPFKNRIKQALVVDQEISCDQTVLSKGHQISVYAHLLLKLNLNLYQGHELKSSMLCSSSLKIKERIMKLNTLENNMSQKTISITLLLLLFAFSSVMALPKVNKEENNKVNLVPLAPVAPLYPKSAAKEGVTGEVKLAFVVTKEGKVKNIEVIDSTPGDVFVKSAVKAMKQWTFAPVDKETQGQQVIKFAMN